MSNFLKWFSPGYFFYIKALILMLPTLLLTLSLHLFQTTWPPSTPQVTPPPTPRVPESRLYQYPPASLGLDTAYRIERQTALTGQGHGLGFYKVEASSVSNAGLTSNVAYAFDQQVIRDQTWMSTQAYHASTGAYLGSTMTIYAGNIYEGEWIQIQLPYAVSIAYYELAPMKMDGYGADGPGPQDFVLLGSKTGDSQSWSLVDERTGVAYWQRSALAKGFTLSSSEAYSFYRLCIKKVQVGTQYSNVAVISEFKLYSTMWEAAPVVSVHVCDRCIDALMLCIGMPCA